MSPYYAALHYATLRCYGASHHTLAACCSFLRRVWRVIWLGGIHIVGGSDILGGTLFGESAKLTQGDASRLVAPPLAAPVTPAAARVVSPAAYVCASMLAALDVAQLPGCVSFAWYTFVACFCWLEGRRVC